MLANGRSRTVQRPLEKLDMRRAAATICVTVLACAGAVGSAPAQRAQQRTDGAFDFSRMKIPFEEIRRGGPPKDGIPALSDPRFVPAGEARFLRDEDRVVVVVAGDEARAYPLKILNYHEVVNDELRGVPFAVTYCPLCDSVAVFDRRTEIGVREFGVSGMLYNSNVLLYDRAEREGLWSQVMAEGVSGPGSGTKLTGLPFELTTWKSWRARFPDTQVLSTETGYRRNYFANPYARYLGSPRLMFPVRPQSRQLPAKDRVLGVWAGEEARAYPVSALRESEHPLREELAGRQFTLVYDSTADSIRVTDAEEGVQWMYSFWFAWYAFHPQTKVYEP